VHTWIKRCRVAQRQIDIVIAYGDEVAAQSGKPGGGRQVEEFIGVEPSQLGVKWRA
jgi:hypothetical protein